jgi:hypothetical protein
MIGHASSSWVAALLGAPDLARRVKCQACHQRATNSTRTLTPKAAVLSLGNHQTVRG